MNSQSGSQAFPSVAKYLGYGGVIPFVVLAFSLVAGVDLSAYGLADATAKLLAYAAVIVSFIGAVHWGVALGISSEHQSRLFLYSVLPALFAWVWTFLPAGIALIGMSVTIFAMYFIDRQLLESHVPQGYLKMRLHLTVVVGLSLLLAALRVL